MKPARRDAGLLRQRILTDGLQVPIGKRKAGQAQRWKLVHWSPELRAVIDEAMSLQRTAGMYVFENTPGQQYSRRVGRRSGGA